MIQKLGIYALVAVALLVVGFGLGWHWKGVSTAAGQTKAADKTITAITDNVNKQAAKQSAQLAAEQAKSLALNIEQTRIQSAGVSIQLEIANAQFTPSPLAPVAKPAVCPDVLGSPDFMRLYNAAARGTPATAASTGTR